MAGAKDAARAVVDAARAELVGLSRSIHDNPELCFEEHAAAQAVGDALAAGGFEVERGAFGLPTALAARAGSGPLSVVVCAEYDALPGVGHACGHNLIAAAAVGAGLALASVADEIGLMLWEEVPVYWTIHWENPSTFENARGQLADLIIRDRNRASVVVWSVANETPVSEARTRFLRALVDTARSLDDSRLVSAAMEVRIDPADPDGRIVDDPFLNSTDLLSFNQYIGWYDGLPERLERIHWSFAAEKPVFISEFGADAKAGFHGDALTRFSEEYQAELYRRTLEMLGRIPGWRGASPWILCDFRSPRRPHPAFQNGWNRKGLISSDGIKKQAFGVLKRFYEEKAADGR